MTREQRAAFWSASMFFAAMSEKAAPAAAAPLAGRGVAGTRSGRREFAGLLCRVGCSLDGRMREHGWPMSGISQFADAM